MPDAGFILSGKGTPTRGNGPRAGVAQSVAQLSCKQQVRGSSPLASSLTRANTASRRRARSRPHRFPTLSPDATGSTPSGAAARRDSRLRRPKYTSCVIDTAQALASDSPPPRRAASA
jgi:hypothetical protein